MLASVSPDYYARLEQGRRITPSPGVLDAIASALDLDEASRTHLGHLIGVPLTAKSRRVPSVQRVSPRLHVFLDALEGQPAFILGRRSDVLASNRMARTLLTDFNLLAPRDRNYARWVLLSDEARALFVDWDVQARAVVENLRLEAGNDPTDRATMELIADLTAQSAEFRHWWKQHRVHQRTFGTKRLRHPIAGELTIAYESLVLPGDPDQTLFVYTTEPGSKSRQALDLLASWTAPPKVRSAAGSAGPLSDLA